MAETSAIIIAAGMGRRLEPLTLSVPKCMLALGSRTVIARQLSALDSAGITRVSVVRGHLKEKIALDRDVVFFDNDCYRHNNILASLFCADKAIVDDVLICYSDIVFTADIVCQLLSAPGDITIAVDRDWRRQYLGRSLHPVEEAEKVMLDVSGCVARIGKHLDGASACLAGEFIGMLRLSGTGAELFRTHFRRCQRAYAGAPFQQAESLAKAYLTDFLQELIEQGETVGAAVFSGGWLEIDTTEDLERARRIYRD